MTDPKEIVNNKAGCCVANAIIYLTCWRDEGSIEYLHKAKNNIDKLLEFEGANNINATPATETKECWPQTMDAKIWTNEFCKLNTASNYGFMLGWFAKAIMAGYDTAMNRLKQLQAESIPAPEAKPLEPLPFDLEAAKAGAPIMRRNGEKMRFVSFDEKLKYPLLVASVQFKDGTDRLREILDSYPRTGSHGLMANHDSDLVMAPTSLKKCEGWVNLYKISDGRIFAGQVNEILEECETLHSQYKNKIGVGLVTWTEKV